MDKNDLHAVASAGLWAGNKEYTEAQTQKSPGRCLTWLQRCWTSRETGEGRNQTYTGVRQDPEAVGVGVTKP